MCCKSIAGTIQVHPKRNAIILIVVCLGIGFCIADATGDVLFNYGFTPKGIALGGAYSALVDDFSSSYYNPAGGAWVDRPTAGIGYMVTGNDLWSNEADPPELDRTQGLIFGTVLPLPLGSYLENRFAFGFSCFFPDGVVLDIEVPFPSSLQWVNLQNSGRSLSVIPTLSVRLIDGLSIGGGAQLFDNTSGQISATVDPNGQIEATVGQDLTTSAAAIAGISFVPGTIWEEVYGLHFGIVYREKFYTKYKIPVNTYIGPVPLEVTFEAISLFMPRQIVFGTAWEDKKYSVELDLSYNFWSEMPDPNLFIDVNFTIPLLPIEFSSSEPYEPDFEDTVTTRAGVEVRPLEHDDVGLGIRFGYFWDPSPVPAQTGVTNYLDSDRHVFSTGAGVQWLGIKGKPLVSSVEFDVAVQYQYMQPRKYYKNENVGIDNPGYPWVEYGGGLWSLSVTLSTRFDYN